MKFFLTQKDEFQFIVLILFYFCTKTWVSVITKYFLVYYRNNFDTLEYFWFMNKAKYWGVGVQQNNVFQWNRRYNKRSHTSCEIMLLMINEQIITSKNVFL